MTYQGNDFYCDVALKSIGTLEKEYESDYVLAYHYANSLYSVGKNKR